MNNEWSIGQLMFVSFWLCVAAAIFLEKTHIAAAMVFGGFGFFLLAGAFVKFIIKYIWGTK